ncbi:MAG: M48 family metallopeptidase [Candidatus Thiodiazotropha sp.]|jgi:metalloprotease
MKRREILKGFGALLGITVAAPGLAFDFGKALGAAKSLGTAATLSDEDINAYFKQAADHYDSQHKIPSKGNKYAKRLASLTKGLNNYDGLKLDYQVYLTDDINACAFGNGSVRINSGLMDLMTDDEIRYVIGHEIGHIQAGHSKKRMKTALTTGALREAVAAGETKAGALAESALGGLIEKVILAQHSQSNEKEADDYALAFLKKHKNPPESAISALEKLAKLSGGSSSNWLSTHPSPQARAERMRKAIG